MLLRLDRHDGTSTVTATATALPLHPASLRACRDQRPSVAVVGPGGRVAGLEQHLPAGWVIRHPASVDGVLPGELVLLVAAGVPAVTRARQVLPGRTAIVALVDEEAPVATVAGVLTAGADACVRGGELAVLASHLVACRRRRAG
jgi:hypothetical protein